MGLAAKCPGRVLGRVGPGHRVRPRRGGVGGSLPEPPRDPLLQAHGRTVRPMVPRDVLDNLRAVGDPGSAWTISISAALRTWGLHRLDRSTASLVSRKCNRGAPTRNSRYRHRLATTTRDRPYLCLRCRLHIHMHGACPLPFFSFDRRPRDWSASDAAKPRAREGSAERSAHVCEPVGFLEHNVFILIHIPFIPDKHLLN